jgi:hypothetical protein
VLMANLDAMMEQAPVSWVQAASPREISLLCHLRAAVIRTPAADPYLLDPAADPWWGGGGSVVGRRAEKRWWAGGGGGLGRRRREEGREKSARAGDGDLARLCAPDLRVKRNAPQWPFHGFTEAWETTLSRFTMVKRFSPLSSLFHAKIPSTLMCHCIKCAWNSPGMTTETGLRLSSSTHLSPSTSRRCLPLSSAPPLFSSTPTLGLRPIHCTSVSWRPDASTEDDEAEMIASIASRTAAS